jgi:hypothetical protein
VEVGGSVVACVVVKIEWLSFVAMTIQILEGGFK